MKEMDFYIIALPAGKLNNQWKIVDQLIQTEWNNNCLHVLHLTGHTEPESVCVFGFWFSSPRFGTRSELKRRGADGRRDAARRNAAHGALWAAAAAVAARPAAPPLLRRHRRPPHLRPVRGLLEQLQPQVRPGPGPGERLLEDPMDLSEKLPLIL